MKYIFGFILAISITGCAVTWTGIAAFAAGAVTVAEDVGGIVKVFKKTKEYLSQDNNVSE